MRIILDGMGGDHAPDEIIKGAVDVADLIDHEIVVVGDEKQIEKALEDAGADAKKFSIIHAPDVIENTDTPVKAIRQKKNSSMVIGLETVRDGAGDLFISAGNSGALMTGATLITGKINGIYRPALGSTYPILGMGKASLLLDAGANAECKPHNLLQFAVMGSIYAKDVIGKVNPTIGLVNMGTEPGKGSTFLKEAYKLIESNSEELGLNFIGNVEARDLPIGICDVIVCDGLVGNVVIKMTEGMALSISHLMRRKFSEGVVAKAGAALLYGKLAEIKKAFDYTEYGGAPVLGVKGAVVKMHGSSDATAVRNSIAKAVPFMENRVVNTIEKSMKKISEIFGDVEE
ncbi:MAG: phosphate acyltransferase PlsX [Clostridiales Family XIII bacterium]|jgi:glycerol-3-phosphate acyltransferase PlsX|nr:phosphate acyltransferase PlsX [Clostridiales Family XIII bacterium]